MRALYLAIWLLQWLHSARGAAPASQAETKLEKMQKAADMSENKDIVLTNANFTRFITGVNRDYTTILLFTAASPENRCSECLVAQGLMNRLSKFNTGKISEKATLMWASIDVAHGREVFQKYEIMTAPHVYIVPPKGKWAVMPTNVFRDGLGHFSEELSTALDVPLTVIHDTRPMLILLSALAIIWAAIVQFVNFDVMNVLKALRWRGGWALLSAVIYTLGAGGIVFCIIRQPRWYTMKDGKVKLFSIRQREQYWLEGMVIVFLNACMAMSCVVAYSTMYWRKVPAIIKNFIVCLCIAVFIHCFQEFLALYYLKIPYYSMDKMLPPQLYWLSNPPSTITKSSGLVHRLCRLSYLWLYKYRGLTAFFREFKVYVYQYLVRLVRAFFGLDT